MNNSLSSTIEIAGRKIGPSFKPFIIAEMSGNHNQSLERALEIVQAAADAGADAVKLQTYTAETMTLNISEGHFFIENKDSLWKGSSLYDLYEKAHTPWEWHKPIMEKCRELGLICFSSPFDATAVDFLETLDVPAYKIASFEIVDLALIRKVARTGKPLIISTGMASEDEISDALNAAKNAGAKDIVLLKCTSSYPAEPKDANLNSILTMRDKFDTQIGLSDHTPGFSVAVASIALGVTIIEKHFTLNRKDGGVDSAFSLEPQELATLVKESAIVHSSLGSNSIGITKSETASKQFRRSLYVVQDIAEGECFTDKNLRAIRPGFGLSPKFFEEILGKQSSKSLKRGAPLEWSHVTNSNN